MDVSRTPVGCLYGQYVQEIDKAGVGGSLVRVKVRLADSLPVDLAEWLDGPEDDVVTFFLLGLALRDGVATEVVGRTAIPDRWKTVPMFRVGNDQAGRMKAVWDREGYRDVPLNPAIYSGLPELKLVTELALIYDVYERLGWPIAAEALDRWYEGQWGIQDTKLGGSPAPGSDDEASIVVSVDAIADDLERLTLADRLRRSVAVAGGSYQGSEVSVRDGRLRFFLSGDAAVVANHTRELMDELGVDQFTINVEPSGRAE